MGVQISPTNSHFVPSPSTRWVNGLWFASLMFSLMSAFCASLAKGWVTQYASLVTGANWHDAFLRHRHFTEIHRWQLKIIIQCFPILIHAAFFLFSAGLVILLFHDDIAVAGVIIYLVFSITMIYLGSTIHPVYSSDSPFRTPLSSFIVWYLTRPSPIPETSQPLNNDAWKAQALKWLLTESPDGRVAVACVQAIAGLPFWPDIQNMLYQSQVADMLSQGLIQCVQSSNSSDVLKAYLHAILHLIQTARSLADEKSVSATLLSLVDPGGPLHLHHNLKHDVQGIALCVKGRILLLHSKNPYDTTLFNVDIPIMLKSSDGHLQHLLQEVSLLANNFLDTVPQEYHISTNPEHEPTFLEMLKNPDPQLRYEGHNKLTNKVNTGKCFQNLVRQMVNS
jgi:hypothetical protein